VDVQGLGYNRNVAWDTIFPEALPHVTSLGFYGTEWPYSSSVDHADYLARANRFWVGENGDPSDTSTLDDWKGIAHYVPARSSVNDVPFVTDFNTGQGHLYAVDGEVLHSGDWNQRGLQDVMPTWRWLAESAGTPLVPELDWTDAWVGGSCLRISGDLSPANETNLKLFKADLTLPPQAEIEVAFRRGVAGAESRLEVGLAFDTNPSSFTFVPVGAGASAGWNTATLDLSAYAGQTVSVISLRFTSPVSEPGYEIRVGRLALRDGPAGTPAAASGAHVEAAAQLDATHASARLRWTASPDPVRVYDVYRRNPGGGRSWIGGTCGAALFVPSIARLSNEVATVIEIEAVGRDGGRAAADTTSLYWGPGGDNLWPCPTANGPYCAVTGQPLTLSAQGSFDPDGTIVSWDWTFGDGDTGTGPEPTHAWTTSGTYDVVLTVVDNAGRAESVAAGVTVSDTASDPLPDLAWYPMDEGFGAVAGDSTGQGNDAAISGAAWTAGPDGGALFFDGIDDYAIVPDYPKSSSTLTVSAWVRADSRPQWASIAKNWALSPGAFHLGLYEDDGDLQAFVAQSNETTVGVREGTPLPLGEWQHVALVCDGDLVRLYRNGFEVDRAPYDGTLLTTRAALGIGVKTNGAGTAPNNTLPSFWNGSIDDLRIYGRALCQNEVRALAAWEPVTGAGSLPGDVTRLWLAPAHPNPFTEATRLEYALPTDADVSLTVYDVAGRRVRDLVRRLQPAGRYAVQWDGRSRDGRPLAPGVYFVRIEAAGEREVRKVLRLR
ncbi:MAG: PKD domain-containing protein, partial [Gemmatimonadetes bacterium]|nr:PKD domain-containing protein [Gemmatimonadota bacterium]